MYNKARYFLEKTTDIFYDFVELKRNNFISLIRKALNSPNKTISKFLFDYETVEITNVDIFIECLEEILIDIDKFYAYDLPSQKDRLKDLMYYTFETYEAEMENEA